jgi:hypothetical protein
MSNPVCNNSTLNQPCYKAGQAITAKQQKALKVYARVLELAAIGGTDYSATMSSTLLSDAAVLANGYEESDRDAALVGLAFTKATAAGASVPSTLNAKIAAANCLVSADERQLEEAILLLECKLGFHKSYPQ